MAEHLKTPPPKPSTLSELPIPSELEDIVLRCLEKEPSNRYACVNDLRSDLDQLNFTSKWNNEKAKDWWKLHGDGLADHDWEHKTASG